MIQANVCISSLNISFTFTPKVTGTHTIKVMAFQTNDVYYENGQCVASPISY